jgi:Barstar (barnase inhibitor)
MILPEDFRYPDAMVVRFSTEGIAQPDPEDPLVARAEVKTGSSKDQVLTELMAAIERAVSRVEGGACPNLDAFYDRLTDVRPRKPGLLLEVKGARALWQSDPMLAGAISELWQEAAAMHREQGLSWVLIWIL